MSAVSLSAQNLPEQFHFEDDGHRLIRGGVPSSGFYDEEQVDTIFLEFEQANYWNLLLNNYYSGADLLASLTCNGETYDSVGVRFKGKTSFMQTQNEQKKSFNITMDYMIDGQNLGGYETINLNNCFDDPSFLREVLYYNLSRNHCPMAKGNFVELYINGESWGLYPNIQQLDKEHAGEWFLDDEATRWRCEKSTSAGGFFGAGYCSLNYLGSDTATYKSYYKLKKAYKENPWTDLVHVCDVLNNVPDEFLVDSLNSCLDVDAALWYLAHENLYTDEDGYIFKGGMDYYVYYDVATNRLTPVEYDGNSAFHLNFTTQWTPFEKATNDDYPLLNILLNNEELRQRYLAHVRVILSEYFIQNDIEEKIDAYVELIDERVQNDTKKLYSYSQFVSQINALKNYFSARSNFIWGHPEVGVEGVEITNVTYSSEGVAFNQPGAGQEVVVTAGVGGDPGVDKVVLYYGTGFMGRFQKTLMFDDGEHGDGDAGDGLFGGTLPGHGAGEYVRFYIEAIAANTAATATYNPAGAEHDVYVYQVQYGYASDEVVVINEVMASNETTMPDESGEYDDWIEFYNTGEATVNMGGYYLSDKADNLTKWTFPENSLIPADGYLIIWADEDGSQGDMHCNFKLSASGEQLFLVNPSLELVDTLTFGPQQTDMGYARMPNGTGPFVIQQPTYNANNQNATGLAGLLQQQKELHIYPNPSSEVVNISYPANTVQRVQVLNLFGRLMMEDDLERNYVINVRDWADGIYFVRIGNQSARFVVRH